MKQTPAKDIVSGFSGKTLKNIPFSMVLSDPNKPDNPLVFVNEAFEMTTGYSFEEAVGRNCRFLQGPDTDPAHVASIRDAVEAGREHAVDILNYRKDGTSFLNRLLMTPIYDDEDETHIVSFLGIQTAKLDPTSDAARAEELRTRMQELQHRVKNHLSMVLSLIRVDGRTNSPDQVIANLTRRVTSLGELYDQLASPQKNSDTKTVPLGAYISRICVTTQDLTDPRHIIVNVDLDTVDVDGERASHIGMFVSEVLNNALQHAFDEIEGGEVKVSMAASDDFIDITIVDNGRGLGESGWPKSGSLGGRIVTDMARILNAELTVESDGGTSIRLKIPREDD